MIEPTRSANIIGLQRILPQQKAFCKSSRALVEDSLALSKGLAMLVVHPLFLMDKLNDFELIGRISFLQELFKREDYPDFASRFTKYLRSVRVPMFVLVEGNERQKIEAWLGELSNQTPMVIVPTERLSVEPLVFGMPNKFKWFSELVIELGVRSISLIGEMAYVFDGKKMGCVNDAAELFHALSPGILPHLTYPNAEVGVSPIGNRYDLRSTGWYISKK